MAADISKHLERAKRFLEKNRVEDAIEAYLAVIEAAPQHQEATQALGDLYARMEQPDRAAVYYGMLFDLLIEPRDEIKALAIYNRFLRPVANQQPPERIARYAFLQQKQNRYDEAIEQYSRAAEMFAEAGRSEDALFCWERTAQLAPDNIQRQLRLAEAAEKLNKTSLAARAYLRTGQLASASGATAEALKFLGRAFKLAPHERGVALLYADATLKAGDAATAAALLEPFAANEKDATFLDTYADALMSSGQLDRARVVLEGLLREKNEGITRLFELVDGYVAMGLEGKAVEVLTSLKRRMFADKKQNEFAAQMDGIGVKHPDSLPIVEFWAQLYNELNRESQYFEILIKLFDAYFATGNIPKACDTIEKLLDIDAYDHRNQERIGRLKGKADEGFFRRISGRVAGSSGSGSAAAPAARQPSSDSGASAPGDEAKKMQALEDLIVQTEIFLQYSLQAKAMERLQKIAAMFP
ncbi:MAG TPA: tetratricopeptide repeat protein, partial [Candidatus Acidoferrum sp.]|nr:tetratricopeptide repeat protein [Candidatus Acidoferrum sp.]